MLSIDRHIIEDSNNLLRCSLNYPVIKQQKCEGNIIQIINKLIYEDIISFKDVSNYECKNSKYSMSDYTLNAISEYRVTFNKNYIISIPIEFSQLIGLYDITYINSYNYDIALGRCINLNDIFDNESNYIELINKKLLSEINNDLNEYRDDNEVYKADEIRFLYNAEAFYIEDNGIVICFSSYEVSQDISCFIELKLLFSNYKAYLSRYTIDNICNYND